MPRWLTRRVVAGLSIFGVVWLIVVSTMAGVAVAATYQPSPHEVHTPGSSALNAHVVASEKWVPLSAEIEPSESLDMIRCQLWKARPAPKSTCSDGAALAAEYFPSVTQTPKTLYVPWAGCYYWTDGAGGFNVEYQPSRRTLVIHCFSTAAWITWGFHPGGVLAQRPQLILVVPTDSLQVGDISIVRDNRKEQFLRRDQSIEFELATTTISGR